MIAAVLIAAVLALPAAPAGSGAGIGGGPECPEWTMTTLPGHSYAITENGTQGSDPDPARGGIEATNVSSGTALIAARAERLWPAQKPFAGVRAGDPAWLEAGGPVSLGPPSGDGTEQAGWIRLTLHVPPGAATAWYVANIVTYVIEEGSGPGAQLGSEGQTFVFWQVGDAGPAPASVSRAAPACARAYHATPAPPTWITYPGCRVRMGTVAPDPHGSPGAVWTPVPAVTAGTCRARAAHAATGGSGLPSPLSGWTSPAASYPWPGRDVVLAGFDTGLGEEFAAVAGGLVLAALLFAAWAWRDRRRPRQPPTRRARRLR